MRVKFADINGVRTRYLYAGDGPPLLHLHGVGMSADCFLRNIHPLASRFSVFVLTVYALPGRLAAYKETIESCIVHLEDASTRVFDRLEQIACPTKVIVGRDDIRADWRWHEKGVARMPDASLTVYERCGHMPFLEHAQQFNSEVSSFLGGGGSECSCGSSQEMM